MKTFYIQVGLGYKAVEKRANCDKRGKIKLREHNIGSKRAR